MSVTIRGNVDQINDRVVTIRSGPNKGANKTAYSVKVTAEDGSSEWYGWGFTRPDFREGSTISFTASQNDKGYWDADASTTEVSKEGPSAPARSTGGAVAAVNNRDKSITLQTAYKVAALVVPPMLQAGFLKFSTAANKQDESQDAYLKYIDWYAYELQQKFLNPDKFNPSNASSDSDEEDDDDLPF